MKPIISVIVPYFKPPLLRFQKCISSLLDQTFPSFELLLVDDGNTETELKEVVEEFQKDPRITYLHYTHRGVAACRNAGIDRANGQYIAFVDSDDYVEETYLQKLYRAITDCDLAICGVADQFYPVVEGWFDRRVFWSQPILFNGLQYQNFSVNKLYKKDLLDRYHIRFQDNIQLGEDALFLQEYYKHCLSFRCIGDLLYHYIPNNKSAVRQFHTKYWQWERKVIRRQWEAFHQYPISRQNETGMLRWLFIKYKGAFYYYIYHMGINKKTRKIIAYLMQDPLFGKLRCGETGLSNAHFTKNEHLILEIWKRLGVTGVILTYQISIYRRR